MKPINKKDTLIVTGDTIISSLKSLKIRGNWLRRDALKEKIETFANYQDNKIPSSDPRFTAINLILLYGHMTVMAMKKPIYSHLVLKKGFYFIRILIEMNPEIFVITLYLFLIFGIAIYSKVKARNNNDNDSRENILRNEYLADNRISRGESLFSIIATEVSALTFIGIPAFAFGLDYRFIYLYFGAIVGRAISRSILSPSYLWGAHYDLRTHDEVTKLKKVHYINLHG